MALLSDVILRDTRANQPAANTVGAGTIYGVTDEGNILERSTGATWEPYSPVAGGTGDVSAVGTLTSNALVIGQGATDVAALGSLGTTTTVLHGNAAGAPTFGAVVGADLTNATVTLAKVANAAANDTLLGSGNSGSGASYAEITLGTNLSMSGTTLNVASAISTLSVGIVNGRLTLTTGVPVTTADVTGASTVYFTPYNGNQIALYDGAAWQLETFAQLSLVLSALTSGKNYDVFIDYNGGTPQIVLGTAWTNDTTRAVALTTQDGVYVLTGATDHRYVGTIRTTSTTTTEDSGGGTTTQVGGKRFVWNYHNRVRRALRVIDTTDSWSYTTNTWRQANGASGNKVEYVLGVNEVDVEARVLSCIAVISTVGRSANAGVGVDSTSSPTGLRGAAYINNAGGGFLTMAAEYRDYPGLGYHFLAWLEKGPDGTGNFKGDDAGLGLQSGLVASLWA